MRNAPLLLKIAEEAHLLDLDLDYPADRRKLQEQRLFLDRYQDHLAMPDEIHRVTDLFGDLRGIMDRRRRRRLVTGRFLILGSA